MFKTKRDSNHLQSEPPAAEPGDQSYHSAADAIDIKADKPSPVVEFEMPDDCEDGGKESNDPGMRSYEEIMSAEKEMCTRVWYYRCHLPMLEERRRGIDNTDPDIWPGALEAARKARKKYGRKNLVGPYSDLEWGMILAKLSALRWVTGVCAARRTTIGAAWARIRRSTTVSCA